MLVREHHAHCRSQGLRPCVWVSDRRGRPVMATHQCAHFAPARENHGIFLRSSAEVIRNQGQILASTLRCQIPTRHTRSKVSCPYLAARNPAVRSIPTIGRSRGCRRTAASARSGHLLPAKPPVGEALTQDVPAQFRCAPPQAVVVSPTVQRPLWVENGHSRRLVEALCKLAHTPLHKPGLVASLFYGASVLQNHQSR